MGFIGNNWEAVGSNGKVRFPSIVSLHARKLSGFLKS